MKVNVHSQNSKGWTDIAYTRPTRGDYDGAIKVNHYFSPQHNYVTFSFSTPAQLITASLVAHSLSRPMDRGTARSLFPPRCSDCSLDRRSN